jgi:LuxR family transcriptional regulator, maltose regulon positive regulatory protein
LDGSDDEPGRFWTYVLTALHSAVGVGGGALAAMSVPGVDAVGVGLPMLLEELASTPGEQVLILDDYHAVHDGRIHEGVEFLLAYLPSHASAGALGGRWINRARAWRPERA